MLLKFKFILFFQHIGGIVLCHAAIRDDQHGIPVIPNELLPITRGEWLGRNRLIWNREDVLLFIYLFSMLMFMNSLKE